MDVILAIGAALSWFIGGLALVASSSILGQILGGVAILNGTVAFTGAAIIRSRRPKSS